MKHMKTVTVPASTKKVVDYVECDLCKQKISQESVYDVDDVSIYHKTGQSYPEGGSGDILSYDICGECFNSVLVPFLSSKGAEPTEEEWDW